MAAALAADRLGLWPVFFFAVSFMTPLTVVATGPAIGYGQIGETSIPVAYGAMAGVMAVFAVGFVAMARRIPNAGAFYAYIAQGLGRPAGVGAAMVALVAYNGIQVALYGAFGVGVQGVLGGFGVSVHWGVWAVTGWVVVAWLGALRVDISARILGVLVLGEIGIILLLDAVMVANPAGGVVTVDTLDPSALATAGGAAILVGVVAGFVGIEAPAVYSEEARDPQRTVGRAVYLSVALAGVLYAGSAWAMSVAAGPERIVAVAGELGTELFFALPAPHVPGVVIAVAGVLFVTSLFAAMLAAHSIVARYVFALGRERVLPGVLARTNRAGAPVGGSVVQTLVAGLVLVGCLWWGVDPISGLLFVASVVAGLGVLLLLTATSLTILVYFARHPGHGADRESRWRRIVAPGIALVVLGVVSLATVVFFGDLLGVSDPVLAAAGPVGYLLLALAGVGWGEWLRRHRPEVYRGIGLGPHATDRPPAATTAAVPAAAPGAPPTGPLSGPAGGPPGAPGGQGPGRHARVRGPLPENTERAGGTRGPGSGASGGWGAR
ncbi:MAG: APC family permease [Kineosporiaceae bacterium]